MELGEYVRQGEPDRAEKAGSWQTAIGLQQVDGLEVSDYLIDTAKLHIEGAIDTAGARRRIESYYEARAERSSVEDDSEEADLVSQRIVELLGEQAFQPLGFTVINEPFESNSWYFRNVPVRANFVDYESGVSATSKPLVRFLENVVQGTHHELRNRELHIDNKTQEQVASLLGVSVRTVKSRTASLRKKDLLSRAGGKRSGWWEIPEAALVELRRQPQDDLD